MYRRMSPLHKLLFRLHKPLLLLLYQLPRIPLPPLLLDDDHLITTKNEIMTSHLILRRLPLSRLLKRLWMLMCLKSLRMYLVLRLTVEPRAP